MFTAIAIPFKLNLIVTFVKVNLSLTYARPFGFLFKILFHSSK